MVNSEGEVTAGKSAAFISKLLLRSLGFAFRGAFAGAIIGARNGVWSGAIAGVIETFKNARLIRGEINLVTTTGNALFGVFIGSVWAICVGMAVGAAAFFAVSLLGWRASFNTQFVSDLTRLAAKSATWGTVVGSFVVLINLILARLLLTDTNRIFARTDFYIKGVIAGFIIGFFYGAIRAAQQEVRRQRGELNDNA